MLEMVAASMLFMLFIGSITSVWNAFEKQRMHVQARARLDSEAQLARAQMLVDISSSSAVSSWTGQDISITYANGDAVTYSLGPDNQLLRYESSTISTTTAALYLAAISSEAVNGKLHMRCNFARKPFPKSSTTLTAAVDLWWQSL